MIIKGVEYDLRAARYSFTCLNYGNNHMQIYEKLQIFEYKKMCS